MEERFANLLFLSIIVGLGGDEFNRASSNLMKKLQEKDFTTISSDYLSFKACLDKVEKTVEEFDKKLNEFKGDIYSYDIPDYSRKVEMDVKTSIMIDKTKNLLQVFKDTRELVVGYMKTLKIARELSSFTENGEFQDIDPEIVKLDFSEDE